MTDIYQFRIGGALSPELIASFEPVCSRVEDGHTVFSCAVVDEPALFGLVARCETLGLHIIGLTLSDCEEPSRPPPGRAARADVRVLSDAGEPPRRRE